MRVLYGLGTGNWETSTGAANSEAFGFFSSTCTVVLRNSVSGTSPRRTRDAIAVQVCRRRLIKQSRGKRNPAHTKRGESEHCSDQRAVCCCSCTSPRELRCALLLPPCDGLPPLPLPWRKEQNQTKCQIVVLPVEQNTQLEVNDVLSSLRLC